MEIKDFVHNKKNQQITKDLYNKIFIIIFVIIIFWTGVLIGNGYKNEVNKNLLNTKNNTTENGKNVLNSSKFDKILSLLKEKYYDQSKITEEKALDGALAGMVASVGDPYTSYFDKETTESFDEEMSGSFEGIGAEIGIKNNILMIVAPLPKTPAEKAGLQSGDMILKINEEDTFEMSTDVAVSKIRGKKGTEVVLNILKKDAKESKDVTIIRDQIIVESVSYEIKDNIYVIKISSFNDTTTKKFEEIVDKIINDDYAKGIILDLRNNPGGYLTTAIEISSYWIDKGPIVKEQTKNNEKIEHNSYGISMLGNYKTAILINEGSASASEIVSGALQDYKKATLIGKKSFGKGSVQEYQEFEDGTALKVTVAEWLTPNDRNINKNGIEPDIIVDYTIEDFNNNKDPQLDKAFDFIKNDNKK